MSKQTENDELPWYVKAMIAITILVILFVIAIDVIHFINVL